MADLPVVANEVKVGTNVNAGASNKHITRQGGNALEAVAAGDLVDLFSVPGSVKLARADDRATSKFFAALNSAAIGQPVEVLEDGPLELGASANVLPGVPYFLSKANPGKWAPIADVTNPDILTLAGMGLDAGVVQFRPLYSGQEVPV